MLNISSREHFNIDFKFFLIVHSRMDKGVRHSLTLWVWRWKLLRGSDVLSLNLAAHSCGDQTRKSDAHSWIFGQQDIYIKQL